MPKNRHNAVMEKSQRRKMIDYAREKMSQGVKRKRIAQDLGISARELYRILNNK